MSFKASDALSLARFMHDEYEEQSRLIGWQTQESCRVPFDDLPEKNRAVMVNVAAAVLDRMNG